MKRVRGLNMDDLMEETPVEKSDSESERKDPAELHDNAGSDGESSGSSDMMDEDVGDDIREVQVDFEFFTPTEDHFHGMRMLLNDYLDREPWNASEMADTILKDEFVGSVVTANDQVVALVGLVNFSSNSSLPSLRRVSDHLLSHVGGAAASGFADYISGRRGRTALLFLERMRNVPADLASPMLRMLCDEVAHARATEPDNAHYIFDYVLVLTSRCRAAAESAATSAPKKQKDDSTVWYLHEEDELLLQHAVHQASYPVTRDNLSSWWTMAGKVSEDRVAMILPFSAIQKII